MSQYQFFAGVDWGSEEHAVCLLDADGQEKRKRCFEHSGKGLKEMVEWLEKWSGGRLDLAAVGIETPHGAVVDILLERGAGLYSINPKQVDRFRDRYSVAGAKDDERDAWVIADSLRTDMHCFRRLQPDSPEIIELRELNRSSQELDKQLRAEANRLWILLSRYFPCLLSLCSSADEPWLWDLLNKAPTPEKAARLKIAALRQLLRKRRIRRIGAEKLREVLAEPPLELAPGTAQALSQRVGLLVDRLRLLHSQSVQVDKSIAQCLEQLERAGGQSALASDAEIIRSVTGIGPKTTATLLSEAAQVVAERDYESLRAQCGVAPVTRQSGKSRRVLMRRACNKRLRKAMHQAAHVAIRHIGRWERIYSKLRARGCSHARALRTVADRMLRVLIAMLRDGARFDPDRVERRGAADREARRQT